MKTVKLLATVASCSVLLFSCTAHETAGKFNTDEIQTLPCLVVLPTKIPYEKKAVGLNTAEDLGEGARFLQQELIRELRSSQVSRVIDPEQLRYSVSELPGDNYASLQIIGKRSNCPYIIVSTISRFKQRQGGEFAVDEPASATFDLKLMDSRSGDTLWMSTFAETQESLLSNLLSFSKARSRGFKWITAEELVARGVRDKLRRNPYFY